MAPERSFSREYNPEYAISLSTSASPASVADCAYWSYNPNTGQILSSLSYWNGTSPWSRMHRPPFGCGGVHGAYNNGYAILQNVQVNQGDRILAANVALDCTLTSTIPLRAAFFVVPNAWDMNASQAQQTLKTYHTVNFYANQLGTIVIPFLEKALQEVIDLPTWQYGNSIGFVITCNETPVPFGLSKFEGTPPSFNIQYDKTNSITMGARCDIHGTSQYRSFQHHPGVWVDSNVPSVSNADLMTYTGTSATYWTINSSSITGTNIPMNVTTGNFTKSTTLASDFSHLFQVQIASHTGTVSAGVWSVINTAGTNHIDISYNGSGLVVSSIASGFSTLTDQADFGQYCTVTRVGNVLTLRTYSDSGRTALVDTASITLQGIFTYNTLGLMSIASPGSSGSNITYSLSNLNVGTSAHMHSYTPGEVSLTTNNWLHEGNSVTNKMTFSITLPAKCRWAGGASIIQTISGGRVKWMGSGAVGWGHAMHAGVNAEGGAYYPKIFSSAVNWSNNDGDWCIPHSQTFGWLDTDDQYLRVGNTADEANNSYVRFSSVPLLQNSTIAESHLSMYCVDNIDPVVVQIYGVLEPNPQSPIEPPDAKRRIRTNACVVWQDIPMKGFVQTPDLSPIIKELLAQPSWVPGNAIMLYLVGENNPINTGRIRFQSFNWATTNTPSASSPYLPPTLDVEYYFTYDENPLVVVDVHGSSLLTHTCYAKMTARCIWKGSAKPFAFIPTHPKAKCAGSAKISEADIITSHGGVKVKRITTAYNADYLFLTGPQPPPFCWNPFSKGFSKSFSYIEGVVWVRGEADVSIQPRFTAHVTAARKVWKENVVFDPVIHAKTTGTGSATIVIKYAGKELFQPGIIATGTVLPVIIKYYMPVITGVGRNLRGNNLCKDVDAEILAGNKIILTQIGRNIQPDMGLLSVGYLIENLPTWCPISTTNTSGCDAFVPAIVAQRQGAYMPNQVRTPAIQEQNLTLLALLTYSPYSNAIPPGFS